MKKDKESKGGGSRMTKVGMIAGAAAVVVMLGMGGAASIAQKAQPYEAPRVAKDYLDQLAKLPDWNGTWTLQDGIMFDPYDAHYVADDPETFGRGVGEGSYLKGIPLTPEYQKKYDDYRAALLEGKAADPVGSCTQPHGMPRQMGGTPQGPEIIMLPNQVRMTWRHHNATRRIYTDGRAHPTGDDLIPTYMGHSIGRWEGDMLIIDTVGMMAGILDQTGAPVSDQVHVVERMKMVGPDLLYNEITITDPIAFTQPWTVTRKYKRVSRSVETEGVYCEGTRVDYSKGYQVIHVADDDEEQNK